MTVDPQRTAFLRELTTRHDGLLVWKHLDRALRGMGDIDAAAVAADIDRIHADARSIGARTLGATHAITCDHVADKRLQFFVQPHRLPQLFEFDVTTQPSRGLAPWARPHVLLQFAAIREDGIRNIRQGAEAIVSLVYHGLSASGRFRLAGDEESIVRRGLDEDLSCAMDAAAAFAPVAARHALVRLVAAASRRSWNERDAALAYFGFCASAVVNPRFSTQRTLFRARLSTGRECSMSKLARIAGRKVPAADIGAFLDAVGRDGHRVTTLA
jgi:hypothetical protein